MPTKSQITLFQLFFLSFSYVCSGLLLLRETSFLSLLVPLLSAFVYCALGYCFLAASPPFREHDRWICFLSCGKPHLAAKIFAELLALLGAAELVLSWLALSSSVWSFSEFLPIALVAALLLPLAIFFSAHGLTAVGRFSELTVFLILPLFFWIVFFDFAEVDFRAFSENLHVLFVVLPSPVLYMFSMTERESTAMPKTVGKIAVPLTAYGGVAAAVLCAFLFRLYGAGEQNLFLLLFAWTTGIVRLSLLVCVCTANRSGGSVSRLCEQTERASAEES
ncbi:MAG: hypothetical protein IKM00_07385 [Clostridia bacterium]|nr:hypothetical protein [Clostridia bacterium]